MVRIFQSAYIFQIQKQFPLAFEFNEYYLKFLAYHSVSCRFRTFLFDCELERVESGVAAVEDKRGSLTSHHKSVDTGSDDEVVYPGGRLAGTYSGTNLGQSVFDYIEKQNARSPQFFNFMYTPDFEHPVNIYHRFLDVMLILLIIRFYGLNLIYLYWMYGIIT